MNNIVPQLVTFYEEQARIFEGGIATRLKKKKRNYDDLCAILINYRTWFLSTLRGAMVRLRHQQGGEKAALLEALDVADKARPFYTELRPGDRLGQFFNYAIAALYSRYFASTFRPEFVELAPAPESFPADLSEIQNLPLFDGCILSTLMSKRRPAAWDALMRVVQKRRAATPLLAKTFACYMQIIESAQRQEWDESLRRIEEASELYDARKKDKGYRVMEETEGGWKMNEHFVDYRLGPIAFSCLQEALNSVPRLHMWHHSLDS